MPRARRFSHHDRRREDPQRRRQNQADRSDTGSESSSDSACGSGPGGLALDAGDAASAHPRLAFRALPDHYVGGRPFAVVRDPGHNRRAHDDDGLDGPDGLDDPRAAAREEAVLAAVSLAVAGHVRGCDSPHCWRLHLTQPAGAVVADDEPFVVPGPSQTAPELRTPPMPPPLLAAQPAGGGGGLRPSPGCGGVERRWCGPHEHDEAAGGDHYAGELDDDDDDDDDDDGCCHDEADDEGEEDYGYSDGDSSADGDNGDNGSGDGFDDDGGAPPSVPSSRQPPMSSDNAAMCAPVVAAVQLDELRHRPGDFLRRGILWWSSLVTACAEGAASMAALLLLLLLGRAAADDGGDSVSVETTSNAKPAEGPFGFHRVFFFDDGVAADRPAREMERLLANYRAFVAAHGSEVGRFKAGGCPQRRG